MLSKMMSFEIIMTITRMMLSIVIKTRTTIPIMMTKIMMIVLMEK